MLSSSPSIVLTLNYNIFAMIINIIIDVLTNNTIIVAKIVNKQYLFPKKYLRCVPFFTNTLIIIITAIMILNKTIILIP